MCVLRAHTGAHTHTDSLTFITLLNGCWESRRLEKGSERGTQERRGGTTEDGDTGDTVRKFTIKRNDCIRHFFNESVFSGGYFQLFGSGTRIRRAGGGVGPGDKTAVVPVC